MVLFNHETFFQPKFTSSSRFQVTQDLQFVHDNIDTMNREFNFWISQRMVNVTTHGNEYSLARYDVEVDAPRPGTPHVYSLQIRSEANETFLRFNLTARKQTL